MFSASRIIYIKNSRDLEHVSMGYDSPSIHSALLCSMAEQLLMLVSVKWLYYWSCKVS